MSGMIMFNDIDDIFLRYLLRELMFRRFIVINWRKNYLIN